MNFVLGLLAALTWTVGIFLFFGLQVFGRWTLQDISAALCPLLVLGVPAVIRCMSGGSKDGLVLMLVFAPVLCLLGGLSAMALGKAYFFVWAFIALLAHLSTLSPKKPRSLRPPSDTEA